MKINMEYYIEKEEILSEDENKIIENFQKNISIENLLEIEPTINNYIHLSNVKENLLNWYDFKKDATILEIGSSFGELTNLLIQKGNRVLGIENSLKKANYLLDKFKENSDNLEIIVGDFKNINLEEKFDYIVITDYLEKNDFFQTITKAKNSLKEQGTLFIALDNKYGIKNWKGKDNYQTLLNNKCNFTKTLIENNLNKLGIANYKFYYIYPEYKAPNLIYTEAYKITLEDITRNFELNEYDDTINFKENDVLENLIKNEEDIINFFANSFLIEISNDVLSDTKYVTFTNYRKRENQIQTIIKSDKVIKKPINELAKEHIKNIINNMQYFPKENCVLLDKKKTEDLIESEFINGKRLDEIILYSSNVKEEFCKYKEFLFNVNKHIEYEKINKDEFLESLKNEDEEILKKLTFTKYGFVDMIPKNCFVVGGLNLFFDQEWMIKYIPIEFILYRAIINIGLNNSEEILKYFELDVYEELFKKIDEEFRFKIIDKNIIVNILCRPVVSKSQKIENLIIEKNNLKEQIKAKQDHIVNLEDINKNLENEVKDRDTRLTIIANSLSWKITKPLRWLSKQIKKILNKGEV